MYYLIIDGEIYMMTMMIIQIIIIIIMSLSLLL